MTWANGTLVAFDIESTGVDPEDARIVTACVAKLDAKRRDVTTWLADPGVDIPAEAAAIHGITTERAREAGRPARDVVPEIAETLEWAGDEGLPVVIYNAPYDLTVLDRELRRYGWPTFDTLPMIVDPLVMDRSLDRYRRGSRKLVDVCRHYGIALSELDAHTAEGDAVAAARLAWTLARRHPAACSGLETLQQLQARWHAEWAGGFESYLRRQGKPESISRDWPIRPYVEQAGAVA